MSENPPDAETVEAAKRKQRTDVFGECLSDYERLRGYLSRRYGDTLTQREINHWMADNGYGLFVEGVPEADAWRDRYWADARLTWIDEDDYTDWLNSLMEHAPADFDADVAMEELVLRYIRDLEAENKRMRHALTHRSGLRLDNQRLSGIARAQAIRCDQQEAEIKRLNKLVALWRAEWEQITETARVLKEREARE